MQGNSGANRRTVFLKLYEEHNDASGAVGDAVGMRKEVVARIKTEGFSHDAYRMMLKSENQSGERREGIFKDFQEMMTWLGKPLGSVPPPTEAPPAADISTVSQHQERRVDDAGYLAGKNNWASDTNPWTPGTLLAQIWHMGWKRGMEELAQAGAENGTGKPRGRPRGARNKPKNQPEIAELEPAGAA